MRLLIGPRPDNEGIGISAAGINNWFDLGVVWVPKHRSVQTAREDRRDARVSLHGLCADEIAQPRLVRETGNIRLPNCCRALRDYPGSSNAGASV